MPAPETRACSATWRPATPSSPRLRPVRLIDPAAPPVTDGPEGQAAPPAASMDPATSTPGLIDWNAGTGNESLFGDLAPGDTVATETATGQLIDPAAPPVTDGPEGQAAPPAALDGARPRRPPA